MSEQSPARDDRADGPGPDATGPDAPADDVGAASEQGEARVVGLDSADADDVLGAVSSDTARTVLDALHEDPATASGLADRVDYSLQTVQYHLGNLADAGLVDVVDSTTSEKGREMDVYGPADGPVVVFAGDGEDADGLRTVLRQLASAVAFLGLVSLLVQEVLGDGIAYLGRPQDDAVQLSTEAASGGGPVAGLEPGLVFFAGGLAVLAAYLGVWYLRRTGTLERVLPTA